MGGVLIALILSLFVLPASAATVPCDKSRKVTPVTRLEDGAYGKVWELQAHNQRYGAVQVSLELTRRKLTVKAGVTWLEKGAVLSISDIRSVYHVCRSGRIERERWHRTKSRYEGSGLVLPQRLEDHVYVWSTLALERLRARNGFWLTTRITVELLDGRRSSIRATIPAFPLPEGATSPNR